MIGAGFVGVFSFFAPWVSQAALLAVAALFVVAVRCCSVVA